MLKIWILWQVLHHDFKVQSMGISRTFTDSCIVPTSSEKSSKKRERPAELVVPKQEEANEPFINGIKYYITGALSIIHYPLFSSSPPTAKETPSSKEASTWQYMSSNPTPATTDNTPRWMECPDSSRHATKLEREAYVSHRPKRWHNRTKNVTEKGKTCAEIKQNYYSGAAPWWGRLWSFPY